MKIKIIDNIKKKTIDIGKYIKNKIISHVDKYTKKFKNFEKKFSISNLEKEIKHISEKGYLPFVIKFLKNTVFFAGFECLISVYILEMFLIMTKFFLEDPAELPNIIVIVSFTLALEVIVCVAFAAVYSRIFVDTVYKFSNNIDNKVEGYRTCAEVMIKYRTEVLKAFKSGTFLYSTSTVIIPLLLVIFRPAWFTNPEGAVITIPIIGTILGFIWNFTGVFRNQRIFWHKLIPQFEDSKDLIIDKNFKFLLANCVGNVVSIAFIFLLCIIISLNLHPKILNDKDSMDKLLGDHNFIFLTFGSLLALYFKILISMLYSSKSKNSALFPSVRQMFNKKRKKVN